MEHLAGVVENYPQMNKEKLISSHGRDGLSVRYAKLPPLIETSLVGRKSSIPGKVKEEKKEKERIIAESGVPQVECFFCSYIGRIKNVFCYDTFLLRAACLRISYCSGRLVLATTIY